MSINNNRIKDLKQAKEIIKIKKTTKPFNLIVFSFLITTIRGNHYGSSK